MGLIGDLIAIARLKNTTNQMVQNGVLRPEQEKEIWDSAKEAGRQSYAESRHRNSQPQRVSHNCCSNCKYFFWGDCWYNYEGNPGFTRSSYHRFDYHGETQQIDYPNNSICQCYQRDYSK